MVPKFRCFTKNVGMVDVKAIYFDSEQVILYSFNGVENQCLSLKDVELMQSTGLKDKNGVEIYEGDIIDKGYFNLSIENRIGYVEFNQGGDSDGYAHGEWLGWITNNHDSLLDVHEHCTVLGNIYENPHLIEE